MTVVCNELIPKTPGILPLWKKQKPTNIAKIAAALSATGVLALKKLHNSNTFWGKK